MFRDLKGARWVLVLVGVIVAGLLVARDFVATDPGSLPGDLPTVAVEEAADHVGEAVRVCGSVAGARYVPGVEGRPTFLNLGAPHPEAIFTVVIWGEVRARFEARPEDLYAGRRICVRGRVERHEGTPQIVVGSPDQIGLSAGSSGSGG